MLEASERIFVAADVESREALGVLTRQLRNRKLHWKIGLELIHGVGTPHAVDTVHDSKGLSFVDGKLADIPATLAKAMAALARQGVQFVNVFAPTGTKSMKAVVQARDEAKVDTRILAVTVLTSMDDDDSMEAYNAPVREAVIRFATMAKRARCDGLICSARDLGFLKEHGGFDSMLKVTPGIRPLWAVADDQKRIMTPGEAILAGADYLVIGRPIRKPPVEIGSPQRAVELIIQEIEEATKEKESM